MSPSPTERLKPRHSAVVVGGGPAGVAAALALAKLRSWSDVTLVEKHPELTWYDPDRAYVYGLTGRGQETMQFLDLEKEMKEAGFPASSFTGTIVESSGKVRKVNGGAFPTMYQMQRPILMKVLAGGLEEFNKGAGTLGTQVRVLTSSRVVKIERVRGKEGEGERLVVTVRVREQKEGEEEELVLFPSLILGCDGVHSIVRRTLQDWALQDDLATALVAPSRAGQVSHSFALLKHRSPAAGLRFKVLRLPPTLVTRDGLTLKPQEYASFIGSYKGWWMRIGAWPVKDSSLLRTCTMIMRPDHPFWKLPCGDVAAYRAMFEEAFPQIDINAQVPEDIMLAFSSSEGGAFVTPYAADGLAYVLGDGAPTQEEISIATSAPAHATSAVVLAGDAAHAFPPDLGQGLNSAFQDVQAFMRCLESANDDVAAAAAAYDKERAPEAHALARLMSIGSPYFYNQAPWEAKVWQLKFMTRLLLSKVLGERIIAPPAAVLARDSSVPYAEIMKRNDEANWRIGAGLVAAAGVAGIAIALRWRK